MPLGGLEQAESLEQLRWLDNGYKIKVAVTEHPTIGIDTPADLDAAIKFATENKLFD
jgi:3-deoxy-manno-octulosonate cytidylyltransferase (CMP-KDO synthetase)